MESGRQPDSGGADVPRIAAASADAAEHSLERASQDEGLAHAFSLLTKSRKPRDIPISSTDCGNWNSPACQASPLSSKLLPHSPAPSIGMFRRAANALISARWRTLPPPKP